MTTLVDKTADAATDLFSVLPSPPAPCQTCGMAILWLPTTLDAWRCPTCQPPPIRKMIAMRVVLVDVESGISPQWFKLAWIERRESAAAKSTRTLATTPIACEVNWTALDDQDALGDGLGDEKRIEENAKLFVFDDRLGPPLVDGVRVDDEAWWAIGSSEVVWKQFFEAVGKK